jgi:hypothetical protein
MGQVAPIPIVPFDQLNFPIPLPVLDLLFAGDRFDDRSEFLDMNEARRDDVE